MKHLGFIWINVLQTLLRMLPFPSKTGLVRIGNPGRGSPVLLTGNFRLTVERVKRALEGIDAYLLVANSRGVNVWCAATGGHLSNHDVVSVLKTSGIGALVDHRQVILPQLSATGIEGSVVHEKTGWQVAWGPVYATSIPAYLAAGLKKTEAMRKVSFAWPQRLEMVVAWAFPMSLLALLFLPFWRAGVLPLVGLVWGASLMIFMGFPYYQHRLRTSSKNVGFVLFSFGKNGVLLLLWALFSLTVVVVAVLTGAFSWEMVFRWSLGSLVVVLILGLDLTGSTPMFKSGLHLDRLLHIELDTELCKGVGACEQVCPTNVFEVDYPRGIARLPREQLCVQCGACIVQCPLDALYFRSPAGEVVTPETIRRFKLNLLGSRRASSKSEAAADDRGM